MAPNRDKGHFHIRGKYPTPTPVLRETAEQVLPATAPAPCMGACTGGFPSSGADKLRPTPCRPGATPRCASGTLAPVITGRPWLFVPPPRIQPGVPAEPVLLAAGFSPLRPWAFDGTTAPTTQTLPAPYQGRVTETSAKRARTVSCTGLLGAARVSIPPRRGSSLRPWAVCSRRPAPYQRRSPASLNARPRCASLNPPGALPAPGIALTAG